MQYEAHEPLVSQWKDLLPRNSTVKKRGDATKASVLTDGDAILQLNLG